MLCKMTFYEEDRTSKQLLNVLFSLKNVKKKTRQSRADAQKRKQMKGGKSENSN